MGRCPSRKSPGKQLITGRPRFGYGLEMERFKRFRFSVPAVPLQNGFFCISVQFNRKGRFRFRFRFLENGSGRSGSAFGFGKNGSHGSGFRFQFGSWATLPLRKGAVRGSWISTFEQLMGSGIRSQSVAAKQATKSLLASKVRRPKLPVGCLQRARAAVVVCFAAPRWSVFVLAQRVRSSVMSSFLTAPFLSLLLREEANIHCTPIGIVQKVFWGKASAITRMRQKCVKDASKMRLWEKRDVPKCVRNASKLRQKCAGHLLGENTFWTILTQPWPRWVWSSQNLLLWVCISKQMVQRPRP